MKAYPGFDLLALQIGRDEPVTRAAPDLGYAHVTVEHDPPKLVHGLIVAGPVGSVVPMVNLRAVLHPAEVALFRHLDESAAHLRAVGALLVQIFESWPASRDLVEDMHRLENDADRVTHDIQRLVAGTFVLPWDRDDALGLTAAIDDVIDLVDEAVDMLAIYKVEVVRAEAVQLAALVGTALDALANSVDLIGYPDRARPFHLEVRDAERAGDQVLRQGIARLFDGAPDPIEVLRWQDVFDRLETALDHARSATQVLEAIDAKHGPGHR